MNNYQCMCKPKDLTKHSITFTPEIHRHCCRHRLHELHSHVATNEHADMTIWSCRKHLTIRKLHCRFSLYCCPESSKRPLALELIKLRLAYTTKENWNDLQNPTRTMCASVCSSTKSKHLRSTMRTLPCRVHIKGRHGLAAIAHVCRGALYCRALQGMHQTKRSALGKKHMPWLPGRDLWVHQQEAQPLHCTDFSFRPLLRR